MYVLYVCTNILNKIPSFSYLVECVQQGFPFLEVSSIWRFRFVEFLVDEAQHLDHRAGRLGQVGVAGVSCVTG